MQEKTLLNQANSTSNIHLGEFGSVSYDIFGSPYLQKKHIYQRQKKWLKSLKILGYQVMQ